MLRLARHLLPVMFMASAGLFVAHFGAAPSPAPQEDVIPGTAPRSVYAAYDTMGAGWQTTLLLNNTTRVPLTRESDCVFA